MAKKYLSLEEAADFAGLSVQELIRLREAGEIRGFADRGTWKFKADDLDELKRSRQADSNPEVPIFTEDDAEPVGRAKPAGRAKPTGRPERAEHAILDEDEADDEAATIVRGSIHDEDDEPLRSKMSDTSDSDVRLILDSTMQPVDSGVLAADDSDSDVQLVDSSPALLKSESDDDVDLMMTSDSDVRLVGPESDVQLLDGGSDSDVRLAPDEDEGGTDSDVRLVTADSDSDVTIVPEDASAVGAPEGTAFDIQTDSVFDDDALSMGSGSSIQLASESGIALESLETRIGGAPGSEIRLESEDTGVTLLGDSGLALADDAGGADEGDSGISLDFGEDSGIALESLDDSGISLGGDDDSGLSLELDDSGIALESLDDSGIALESLDDSGIGLAGRDGTVPMMDALGGDLDHNDTAMEMPTLDGESEYELATSAHDSGSVLTFDDDDIDGHQATAVRKSGDVSDEFDMTGGDAFDEFGDEEFETAEAEAEDEDEEGFDAFDEDAGFESEFEEGESEADFAPAGVMRGQVAAPAETEWGTGPFVGLTCATLLMVVCGMMMYDLVRSMWSWQDPSGFNSAILGFVKQFMN